MTKRDFFILIIKLFGLYSLVLSLFSALPQYISFAIQDIDAAGFLFITAVALIVGGLFVLLVFKADKVVQILKLEKGFDDDRIELKELRSTDIVKLGAFIIGGLLFIDNVPGFLSDTWSAFRRSAAESRYVVVDNFRWAVSGLNLIVGYLLVNNYHVVARLLNREKE